MKSSILEKLSKELSGGIDTEPKVLYLLAQIRKYIDEYYPDEEEKPLILYFYCDWVLHLKMDRIATKRILRRFESVLSDDRNLKETSKVFILQEKDFYLFGTLRDELQDFLESNGLPENLTTETRQWTRFRKLLVEVLMDAPLVNENGAISSFSYVPGRNGNIHFKVRIRGKQAFTGILKEEEKGHLEKS